MIKEIDDRAKRVELWINTGESANPQLLDKVHIEAKANGEKGYRTVVYESGNEDLYDTLLALIVIRLNRIVYYIQKEFY